MRDDLLELSRTIDLATLGGRLRSARLRAGLTQAQVAGDAVSIGYVSRIESGQRRPDPELLEALAGSLGVTVDEILVGVSPDRVTELRVELDHAQLALATGSGGQALEIVDRILADPAVEELPDVKREASYLRASTLELTGDVPAAIIALEDLAETSPHDLTWLAGLTALCRCYRESGELGRAIEVGNEASRFIEEHGMTGLDEAVRLTLSLAAAYVEQGDVGYASRMCQRVIDRAEEASSPVAKASAYWNLSIIETMRGNTHLALPMTRRALAVLEASGDARNVARLRTELGIQQLLVDPPEPIEALDHLTSAAHDLEIAGALPGDLADNHLAQARAQWLLGNVHSARMQAAETATTARTTTPIVAADSYALLGQIAIADGDPAVARDHFQEAVLLLTGLGADRSAAQLWFELAGLLESVGDATAALDAYRRAAAATGLVAPVTRRPQPQVTSRLAAETSG
ncbi:helix-turn-helix domain-containing protein [Nocardioides sp. LMS-CY]|uniref:Transcriptional regulator with XRE-family HTH domain/Tfp pilus assembly protein PilF n=1 Tax=Nocardioides soli TaxID=1036020 RepID=A0A7W4VXE8_9ACTN|nr:MULTISPECIES: helix-turn-helix transcriptional regulator [Nocardioides]MBB3043510.1 transcriptional regulator with XRE-family HTH domain/Tfp pilus assembly protein PilF [Nocardioides soli]QWF20962.1 helix-turn-helix domain-containing protein [Nocardioides sp. LMS-CY]